jgi:dynein heavy chain
MEYIEENMPPESAAAYGLHANAEVGFKRREAERVCAALAALQPREHSGGRDGGLRPEERAKLVLDDILERLPETPRLEEIAARVDEPSPYTMVALQVSSCPAPGNAKHSSNKKECVKLVPDNILGRLLVLAAGADDPSL